MSNLAGLFFMSCNLLVFQSQPLLAAALILPGMKVTYFTPVKQAGTRQASSSTPQFYQFILTLSCITAGREHMSYLA